MTSVTELQNFPPDQATVQTAQSQSGTLQTAEGERTVRKMNPFEIFMAGCACAVMIGMLVMLIFLIKDNKSPQLMHETGK